jgi:tRNA G10  N-methylase Trm11
MRRLDVEMEFYNILMEYRMNGKAHEMTRNVTTLLEKIKFIESPKEFIREHEQKNLEFSMITGGDAVSTFESYRASIELNNENRVGISTMVNNSRKGDKDIYVTQKCYDKSTIKRERKVNWKM